MVRIELHVVVRPHLPMCRPHHERVRLSLTALDVLCGKLTWKKYHTEEADMQMVLRASLCVMYGLRPLRVIAAGTDRRHISTSPHLHIDFRVSAT
jgi:hypothetical protein